MQWLAVLSHWCRRCTIIQWMKARYLQWKKKSTANYLLFQGKQEETLLLCCYGFYVFFFFLLVSEWKLLLSSTTEIYYVSKWCTLWECLLCAVTRCGILCMESVKASKHVTGILFFKGYVVVFWTTPQLRSADHAESTRPWAHCWLEPLTQQLEYHKQPLAFGGSVCFQWQVSQSARQLW